MKAGPIGPPVGLKKIGFGGIMPSSGRDRGNPIYVILPGGTAEQLPLSLPGRF